MRKKRIKIEVFPLGICIKCNRETPSLNLFMWNSKLYDNLYYWLDGEFICSECYTELQNHGIGKSRVRYSALRNGLR